MIALELDRERFGPAEVVSGRVVVRAAVPSSRSLTVTVAFAERTEDYRTAVLQATTPPLAPPGALAAGAAHSFALQLPAEVLPPYRSQWGELFWEVDAKVDVPGGRDHHAVQRILVLPPGVDDDQLGDPVVAGAPTAPAAPGVIAAAGTALATPAAGGAHPPGWYPDPWLHKRLRWWDGNVWTEHMAD